MLHVPDGKDPDEFVKKHGREAFEELVENALPYVDYKLAHERSMVDLDTQNGKLGYIKGAARILSSISPAEAEIYIKKVTDETGMQEGALRAEIRRASDAGKQREPVFREPADREQDELSPVSEEDLRLQKTMIGILAKAPSTLPEVSKYESIFTGSGMFQDI